MSMSLPQAKAMNHRLNGASRAEKNEKIKKNRNKCFNNILHPGDVIDDARTHKNSDFIQYAIIRISSSKQCPHQCANAKIQLVVFYYYLENGSLGFLLADSN